MWGQWLLYAGKWPSTLPPGPACLPACLCSQTSENRGFTFINILIRPIMQPRWEVSVLCGPGINRLSSGELYEPSKREEGREGGGRGVGLLHEPLSQASTSTSQHNPLIKVPTKKGAKSPSVVSPLLFLHQITPHTCQFARNYMLVYFKGRASAYPHLSCQYTVICASTGQDYCSNLAIISQDKRQSKD